MLYSHRSEQPLSDGRGVVVRFKTPADLKAWRRFVALVPDDSGHRPGTQLDVADLQTDYHRFEDPYLVAEVEGEIVGAAFLVPPDEALGYHREHVLEFHMDVLPGWRRQGVGTALVSTLVDWARTQGGFSKLEAAALSWNEPVVAFLASLGFAEEGRAVRSWLVRGEDDSVDYDDVLQYGLWIGD